MTTACVFISVFLCFPLKQHPGHNNNNNNIEPVREVWLVKQADNLFSNIIRVGFEFPEHGISFHGLVKTQFDIPNNSRLVTLPYMPPIGNSHLDLSSVHEHGGPTTMSSKTPTFHFSYQPYYTETTHMNKPTKQKNDLLGVLCQMLNITDKPSVPTTSSVCGKNRYTTSTYFDSVHSNPTYNKETSYKPNYAKLQHDFDDFMHHWVNISVSHNFPIFGNEFYEELKIWLKHLKEDGSFSNYNSNTYGYSVTPPGVQLTFDFGGHSSKRDVDFLETACKHLTGSTALDYSALSCSDIKRYETGNVNPGHYDQGHTFSSLKDIVQNTFNKGSVDYRADQPTNRNVDYEKHLPMIADYPTRFSNRGREDPLKDILEKLFSRTSIDFHPDQLTKKIPDYERHLPMISDYSPHFPNRNAGNPLHEILQKLFNKSSVNFFADPKTNKFHYVETHMPATADYLTHYYNRGRPTGNSLQGILQNIFNKTSIDFHGNQHGNEKYVPMVADYLTPYYNRGTDNYLKEILQKMFNRTSIDFHGPIQTNKFRDFGMYLPVIANYLTHFSNRGTDNSLREMFQKILNQTYIDFHGNPQDDKFYGAEMRLPMVGDYLTQFSNRRKDDLMLLQQILQMILKQPQVDFSNFRIDPLPKLLQILNGSFIDYHKDTFDDRTRNSLETLLQKLVNQSTIDYHPDLSQPTYNDTDFHNNLQISHYSDNQQNSTIDFQKFLQNWIEISINKNYSLFGSEFSNTLETWLLDLHHHRQQNLNQSKVIHETKNEGSSGDQPIILLESICQYLRMHHVDEMNYKNLCNRSENKPFVTDKHVETQSSLSINEQIQKWLKQNMLNMSSLVQMNNPIQDKESKSVTSFGQFMHKWVISSLHNNWPLFGKEFHKSLDKWIEDSHPQKGSYDNVYGSDIYRMPIQIIIGSESSHIENNNKNSNNGKLLNKPHMYFTLQDGKPPLTNEKSQHSVLINGHSSVVGLKVLRPPQQLGVGSKSNHPIQQYLKNHQGVMQNFVHINQPQTQIVNKNGVVHIHPTMTLTKSTQQTVSSNSKNRMNIKKNVKESVKTLQNLHNKQTYLSKQQELNYAHIRNKLQSQHRIPPPSSKVVPPPSSRVISPPSSRVISPPSSRVISPPSSRVIGHANHALHHQTNIVNNNVPIERQQTANEPVYNSVLTQDGIIPCGTASATIPKWLNVIWPGPVVPCESIIAGNVPPTWYVEKKQMNIQPSQVVFSNMYDSNQFKNEMDELARDVVESHNDFRKLYDHMWNQMSDIMEKTSFKK